MRTYDETAPTAEAAPALSRPALTPHGRLLDLQRSVGNAVVARLVAATTPAATTTPDWLTTVPDATDTVTTKLDAKTHLQGVVHHAKKNAPAEAAPSPDAQKAIDAACAAVAAYRLTLPEPAVTDGITSNQGAAWAGTSWTRYTGLRGALRPPAKTKKNPNPVDTRTDAQKAAYTAQSDYISWMAAEGRTIGDKARPKPGEDLKDYKAWLGDRLYFDIGSMEGGFDSINVYDKQIVTWGAGLGGGSGYVADAMRSLATSTLKGIGAEVTKRLHDAGIAVEEGTKHAQFVVLDPVSKRKYRGDSALQLIKADNRLLMLFTNLARGEVGGLDAEHKEAMRRAAFEGQRHVFIDTYNGSGFKAAVDQLGPTWPYDSIMMVLHMNWWGLAGWSSFKDTGGDMKAIIRKCYTFGKYVQERNGAKVAVRDLAHHLINFGGASSAACWGPEQQLASDKLDKDAYYIETVPEVVAVDAVPEVKNDKGKVTKKGKAAIAHQDPKYRKLL